MIVVMKPAATEGQIADVVERLARAGGRVQRLDGEQVTLSTSGPADAPTLEALPGVAALLDQASTPRVSAPDAVGTGGRANGARPAAPADSEARGFRVRDHWIGGDELFLVAGPCSVEDPDTMDAISAEVAAAGAVALRAGAYKPRTSPYSFQGAGEEGLAMARAAADRYGLLLVSEVMDATQIPVAARYLDVLQVGARNMYNTSLLRELGRARQPVLLKRAFSATIDEWLSAAEYIAAAGNPRVILCERGIRTFETATRNTLDLNAVPVVRARSRLPILVDPSHGTGARELVPAMARAAIAAGADGLLLEVHTAPDRATSDAAQTVDIAAFQRIVREAAAIRRALTEGALGD
jgi:3-deoxy-7-phosphoheptulonate synthase